MKKLFYFLFAIIAISLMTSCSTTRRSTQTEGTQDESNNRATTGGVDGVLGSGTDKVVTIEQPNGNVVTLIPIYHNSKIQGWDIWMHDKNGKQLDHQTRSRRRYQDAYADAYGDNGNAGRGRADRVFNTARDVINRINGYGRYRGYGY